MIKETGFFTSSNEKVQIHYNIWLPDECKPYAVLQIVHGMAEHSQRYEAFAEYLADKGCVVIAHDILGHGLSVQSKSDFGFFSNTNGNKHNINDINTLHTIAVDRFPNAAHFILGHSMGSLLLRQYLYTYNKANISGAIIMGTAHEPWPLVKAGYFVSYILGKLHGKRYRSRFLHNLTLGNKNTAFLSENSKYSWLTSDKNAQAVYENDPLSGFIFTVGAYKDMFRGINSLYYPKNLFKISKKLSLLITSGTMDPIGGYGAGVNKVYNSFKSLGFDDLTIKLWRGMRHEILNEVNKLKVYEYIYEWVSTRSGKDIK